MKSFDIVLTDIVKANNQSKHKMKLNLKKLNVITTNGNQEPIPHKNWFRIFVKLKSTLKKTCNKELQPIGKNCLIVMSLKGLK